MPPLKLLHLGVEPGVALTYRIQPVYRGLATRMDEVWDRFRVFNHAETSCNQLDCDSGF